MKVLAGIVLVVSGVALLIACAQPASPVPAAPVPRDVTPLPSPRTSGDLSLEAALGLRRSVRTFGTDELTDAEIGQLLWAAQGITHPQGYRTAPSAGALYPLEIYVTTRGGVYHYAPHEHRLLMVQTGDARSTIYQSALRQEALRTAPAIFCITAVYERTTIKYGEERGRRYVHLEAGHAAQNLLLQAVSLGLVAVPIGAFDDRGVQDALGLCPEHMPLYLIPVGH